MAAAMFVSLFIFSIPMLCSSAIFPFRSSHRRGLVIFPAEFVVPTDTTGAGTIPPAAPTTPSGPVTNPVTTPSTNVPGGQPQPVTPPDPTGGIPGTTPTLAPPDPAAGGFPGTTPAQPPPNPASGGLPGTTTPMQAPPDPSGGFPGTNPAMTPPTANNAPSGSGQSWCVAKSGVPETNIQVALDYACGIGGADCSAIQQGANCYNPNTLQNHASYAFNSYYQKNPGPTSCDFGGAAAITSTNPSQGSCVFPSSSSSSSPSTTTTPSPNSMPTMTPPTGTTSAPPNPMTAFPAGMTPPSSSGTTPTGSSGMSPNILNASGPGTGGAAAGFGGVPPISNSSDLSGAAVRPMTTGCIIAVGMSIMTGRMILRM